MMAKLAPFAQTILSTAKMDANVDILFSVLHKMRQLYEVELHDKVMELVQGQLTSAELLNTVYSEATINHAQVGVDVGKIEEFYIRYDTTTTAILMMIIKE
jgi:hypothetical protein